MYYEHLKKKDLPLIALQVNTVVFKDLHPSKIALLYSIVCFVKSFLYSTQNLIHIWAKQFDNGLKMAQQSYSKINNILCICAEIKISIRL